MVLEVLSYLGRRQNQSYLMGILDFLGQGDGKRKGLRVRMFLGNGVQGVTVGVILILENLRLSPDESL